MIPLIIIVILAPSLYALWSYLWSHLVAPRVTVSVLPSKISITHGERTEIIVRVRNESRLLAPQVGCIVELPEGLQAPLSGAAAKSGARAGHLSASFSIRGREEVEARFAVYGELRGRQVIKLVKLILSDGLSPRFKTVTVLSDAAIVVHPPAHREGRPRNAQTRVLGTVATQQKLHPTSLEWINIREYQTGDSLRDVAWMQSARHGELMVVERSLAIAERVIVLVNAQCNRQFWAPDSQAVERLYRETMVAALLLLKADTHVIMMTNAFWYGRKHPRQFNTLEVTGPLTPRTRRIVGHWLGELSVYALRPFSDLLKRVRTTGGAPAQIIVFTAFENREHAAEYDRLRAQGHEVIRVCLTSDPEEAT